MQLSAEIEKDSLMDLSLMIERAMEETGRSADNAVSWAATVVAKAGKKIVMAILVTVYLVMTYLVMAYLVMASLCSYGLYGLYGYGLCSYGRPM